jgi:hypothetical protein
VHVEQIRTNRVCERGEGDPSAVRLARERLAVLDGDFDAIPERVRGDSSNACELFRVLDARVGGDDVSWWHQARQGIA